MPASESDETSPLLLPTSTSSSQTPAGVDTAQAAPETSTLARRSARMSAATFWKIGAVYGAAAVGLGAFGAHGLKKRIADPQKITNWGTAAHYQMIHSLALLVARENPVACVFFTAGMTMFSGSIYALTLDTERFRPLGPVTPLGGLCLIAGWLALAFTKGRVRI